MGEYIQGPETMTSTERGAPSNTPRTRTKEMETELGSTITHAHYGWKFARTLEAELVTALSDLHRAQEERDNLLGINAAWKRDYDGEKERGDAWMADCRAAEAKLAAARKEAEQLKHDIERHVAIAAELATELEQRGRDAEVLRMKVTAGFELTAAICMLPDDTQERISREEVMKLIVRWRSKMDKAALSPAREVQG